MIRVVVAGTSSFGLPSFQKLFETTDVSVVGVLSQPARPVGRHQTLEPSAVSIWAKKHRLPLLTPANWDTVNDLDALRALDPDLVVVAAYGIIVPSDFLSIPRYGCINLHASLLPKYRGASPVAATLLAGDEKTGVTFMLMDAGLDTGDILSTIECPIAPDDTTPTLTDRLAQLAATNISENVVLFINGKLPRTIQPTGASYAKKISRADGRATWASAIDLERMSRAYTPWPNLWTTWKEQTFKILSGRVVLGPATAPPGVTVGLTRGQWGVQCADGLFIPTTVQFAGKQPQPAKSIPGSYPGFVGSQLGD